jgi:hypothetical protein
MMLPRRWSHLVRHGLLGTTLLAAPAHAEPCDDETERSVVLVFGVSVSPKLSLVGGIEGRQCIGETSEAMVRLELGAGKPRLIGGARARPFDSSSFEEDSNDHVGLEAGLLLDFKSRFGAHLAVTYGTHMTYGALQLQNLFAEEKPRWSAVLGVAPGQSDRGTSVPGRPILRDGQVVRPSASGLARVACSEDRAVRDHFAAAAQLEASSVWTFLRLAAELAAVGAPDALIAAALDAADDEVRHAELCARAAGGLALAALPPGTASPRFTRRSPHALATLAREAWLEGCLNEGAAAAEAVYASSETTTATTRAMLATIATDEARHAELAWNVLAWMLAQAPELATTLALAAVPKAHPVDAALVRRGIPSAAAARAAWAATIDAGRTRLKWGLC